MILCSSPITSLNLIQNTDTCAYSPITITGQWASTRSDMFPDRFCEALSQLHADAPAHSWKITQTTVEEALCIPKGCLHDVFQEFDEEPVASGSIAQIHRAILKPLNSHAQSNLNANEKDDDDNNANTEKGSLVAVKVRHPNVAQLIDMDFRLMSMIATLIDCFPALRWLRIKSSIEQFSHTMAAQAYLNIEAHHLEVLNHNFRKWDYVDFPQPIFACSKVIIETFEEGKICTSMIEQYDRLAGDIGLNAGDVMPIPLAKFIVTTGVALYLKMLIIDNLMHADLHPGNIMVLVELFNQEDAIASALNPTDELSKKHAMKMARAEVTAGFYGHITMVDAGMVAQLEDDESDNFIGLLSSMGAGDGRTAALAVLNFSDETGYLSAEQEEAFIEDMMDYFDKSCRGYGTNVDVGEVLRGVLGLIKTHHVRVGANYATLVVNALCIEGLAKQVCPTYNVLDAAKPLLNSYRTLPLYKSKSKVVSSSSISSILLLLG
jgi:aarF domain-containing kinase